MFIPRICPVWPHPRGRRPHPQRGRRWLVAAALASLVLAAASTAGASWMVPPNGWRSKDFAILKHDGFYHIFWTRQHKTIPFGPSGRSFGHAVSTDLYIWSQLDTTLIVRPDSWDNANVWAPHVVERDGVFYMFYTGVTEDSTHVQHQRIGLATSTDLFNWNRLDEPVWSCSQVPWTYCDSTLAAGGNFRDPFVMPNPAAPGEWMMLYTANPFPSDDLSRMVIGIAGSTGDPAAWTDLGPLWASHYSYTGLRTAESAFLHQHENTWYLFWTTDGPYGLVWAMSPDPLAPAEEWVPGGTVSSMIGVGTPGWFASEILVDGTHEYFCFINTDRVDIREMSWNRAGTFGLMAPALFHVKRILWSSASVDSGAAVQLRIESTGWFNQIVTLEAVEVDAGGGETPVPLDSLGLPATVALTGAVTTLNWNARTWPDDDGEPGPELVIRTHDLTAISQPLRVVPPYPPEPPPMPGPDPGSNGDDGRRPGDTYDWGFAIRALDGTPLQAGPAVLVQMPEAGYARVDLFDVRGRRIRNLAARELGKGANLLPWDGRTEIGSAAGPGVYFARVTTPQATRWTRVVLRR